MKKNIELNRIAVGIDTTRWPTSVALVSGRREVAGEGFNDCLSGSERLLESVDKVLAKKSFSKQDIRVIYVSDGPGSLTGIRIGLATARGIADALGIKCHPISFFDVIGGRSVREDQKSFVAVETGNDRVAFQVICDGKVSAQFENFSIEDFMSELQNASDTFRKVFVTVGLYQKMALKDGSEFLKALEIVIIGGNPASRMVLYGEAG